MKPNNTYLSRILLGILSVVIYFSPKLILLQDAHWWIHDMLEDSSFNFRTLWEHHQMFNFDSNAKLDYVMNGLPRATMHSGLNFLVAIFAVFPKFWAYLFLFSFIHITAFVGMYLFLSRFFDIKLQSNCCIVWGVSFCFAIIPQHFVLGLSTLGQPILFYSFHKILTRKQEWFDYIIIVLFILFSFIERGVVGIFIILMLAGGYRYYTKREANLHYFLMVFLFILSYVLVEFQMFDAFLNKKYISFREEMHTSLINNSGNFHSALLVTIKTLFTSQYHAGAFFTGFIFVLALASLFYNVNKTILKFIFLIITISAVYGTYPFLLKTSLILES